MLFLLLLFGPCAFQDSELYINEKFRVEFVLLDVVATDKKGNILTDLKESDFVVTENGKKVDITYFEVLDYLSEEVPDSADLPEEYREVETKPVQQIIVALDLESAEPGKTKNAFQQLRRFFQNLDPSRRYLINLYSLERGSQTKGFVTDPKEVIEVINHLETRHFDFLLDRDGSRGDLLLGDDTGSRVSMSQGRGGHGGNLMDGVNNMRELEQAFETCRKTYGGEREYLHRCIGDTLSAFFEQQEIRTERVIGELEVLAYKFKENKGLKTMLFVSPGFALRNISSAVALASAYKMNNRIENEAAQLPNSGTLHLDTDFRRVVHACIKNRVIFHSFDVFNTGDDHTRSVSAAFAGIPSGVITGAYKTYNYEIGGGLQELADESGGTFHRVFELGNIMQKTLDENRYFYVLGYSSNASNNPGKFRKIKVKSTRKKVKVRHRKGYFGS